MRKIRDPHILRLQSLGRNEGDKGINFIMFDLEELKKGET